MYEFNGNDGNTFSHIYKNKLMYKSQKQLPALQDQNQLPAEHGNDKVRSLTTEYMFLNMRTFINDYEFIVTYSCVILCNEEFLM